MKIYCEISIADFEAWSGAVNTLNRINAEGKADELEAVLDEFYPEGIDETELNDILRFESDWCYEMCGIRTGAEIREELAEIREELEELMQNYADDCEDEDMNEEKKYELWICKYADDAEELKEKIEELKAEFDNL